MRIRPTFLVELQDRADLQTALDLLTTWNRYARQRAAVAGRPFPPLLHPGTGIRYARETRVGGRVREDWQDVRSLYATRRGDCEDLGCALASEIPGARAVPVRSSVGWHIIVRLPDGRFVDPSRALGMHGDG